MDKIKQPNQSIELSVRFKLHKGLRELNSEAWSRLNEVLKKLEKHELETTNGKGN